MRRRQTVRRCWRSGIAAFDRVSERMVESGAENYQKYEYDADGNLTNIWLAADMNCDGLANIKDVNPFVHALTDPNDWQATYPECNILNGDGSVNFKDISPFVALLSGGAGATGLQAEYTWDAENRLVRILPTEPSLQTDVKVEFVYDYLGRRIEKRVYAWGPGWTLSQVRRYVWSRWLLLMELDGMNGNAVIREYTWGLDLAGQNGQVNSLEGAGGIGGLLAMQAPGAGPGGGDLNHVYLYDANGNVGQLVDLSAADPASALKATYEYDPYGGVTAQSGSYASENPFRFSTKYWDDETALGYWGYRYYSPTLGRWINRDPIAEEGGLLLYEFVRNSPINGGDTLGKRNDWGLCKDELSCRYTPPKEPPSDEGYCTNILGAACDRYSGHIGTGPYYRPSRNRGTA